LLDTVNLLGRSDLKTEMIKELERHSTSLGRMAQSPGVDPTRLNTLLTELHEMHQAFVQQKGQVAAHLRSNEFFSSIMQRSAIPGGTCSFDLPGYHHWLNLPDQQRKDSLEGWLDAFALYSRAVNMILHLTRNSSTPTNEQAVDGFFTHSLDGSMPVQLIRVAVAPADPYFPEISGGKHRFTVRFMRIEENGHPRKVEQDINFELTCCTI
jgi:cell division protein ZapD